MKIQQALDTVDEVGLTTSFLLFCTSMYNADTERVGIDEEIEQFRDGLERGKIDISESLSLIGDLRVIFLNREEESYIIPKLDALREAIEREQIDYSV